MESSSNADSEGELDGDSVCIREVWNDNLESEFAMIRGVVDDYPYIAMDTEFPGKVVDAVNPVDSYYDDLKHNVNILKLIQLGLTLSDENGNLPTCVTDKFCVWQFNFREFNVNEHPYSRESIALLRQSGIDFEKNYEEGIEARRLGELLIPSGMLLNDDVRWVTFHGSYDFGYLLKLLTGKNLPATRAEFLSLLRLYFPVTYDVKHLIKFTNGLHGGLNKVARQLNVRRIGVSHQAGSDSLLTCRTFVKLKKDSFDGSVPERYAGVLHALER